VGFVMTRHQFPLVRQSGLGRADRSGDWEPFSISRRKDAGLEAPRPGVEGGTHPDEFPRLGPLFGLLRDPMGRQKDLDLGSVAGGGGKG